MNISIELKKILARPLLYRRNIRRGPADHRRILVLMYHRILNKKHYKHLLHDGMYVDPETFKLHVKYINDKFTVINLENITHWKDGKDDPSNEKPFCVLTFDDGWKDFYDNAYPILKSFHVPATVFLPTGFIGTNKCFWTDNLSKIIANIEYKNKKRIKINDSKNKYLNIIGNMEGDIYSKIDKAENIFKLLPNEEIDRILNAMAEELGFAYEYEERSFLSWDEAIEMHQSGFVKYGSHTKNHRILTTISEDVMREELIQSKDMLIDKGLVSSSFVPFAYPNGNYTDRIAEIVEETGYSLAVTTKSGWNHLADEGNSLFRLKRVGIHQDMTSTNAMLACRIHGIY